MTRFSLAFLVVLLIAGVTAADSQNPANTDGAGATQDAMSGLPGAQGVCPDGTSATMNADGSQECVNTQDTQGARAASGTVRRPSTTGSESDDATIQSQLKTRSQVNLQPEPLTEFQKFVAATTGQILPVYGASLFRNVPTTFAPSNLAPASADYIIGPEDELRIRLWGQVNYTGNLRVDRSGDIYLPEVGAVHVAGLQFSALDQHLREAIGRVYRNFDLSADMGRIRSMQVYVTGQARTPGVYTVSSLSTLVDTLFASGGPSAQGSLRHIQLRRNGTTVTDFDLYALLIHGDKSKDVPLLPEDVLFIPPTGPQVALLGSVHIPGIYESRGDETIGDLLDEAGKTTAIASGTRISVERAGEHQVREAMEFPLDASGLATRLAEGDILRVYSIAPAYQKTVTLRGDVANAGRFGWHEGMHLSDLIPDRDSLLSRDYWWKRSHLGLPGLEFEPFVTNLDKNLRGIYSGNGNTNPAGANGFDPQNTLLSSQNLNNGIGSYTQDALTAGLAVGDGTARNYNNDSQGQNQSEGGALASELNQANASTEGNSNLPRRTQVQLAAPEIDWNYAVIERLNPDTLKTSLIPFDLGKLVMNHDTSQDLPLQAGDTVTVFSQADIRVPLEQQTKYVRLEGEFVHAGVYSVQPGETLRDLVERAGGLTGKAYLYGSEFDRESTRILQQQRMDEYIRRVDLDAERGTLALTASATASPGNAANAAGARSVEQELVARLRQVRATGRIVLSFQAETTSATDLPAMSLEDGDSFMVPSAPASVNVVGAVYDQNSFLFRDKNSTGLYLKMAGGPDRDADWRHSFVIRADGSVVSRESQKGYWGNTFAGLNLHPGDTIVVPDKSLRPTALRGLLDWTQIFSQLAFGAAAVNVIR